MKTHQCDVTGWMSRTRMDISKNVFGIVGLLFRVSGITLGHLRGTVRAT